jgi:hypothetical protein
MVEVPQLRDYNYSGGAATRLRNVEGTASHHACMAFGVLFAYVVHLQEWR